MSFDCHYIILDHNQQQSTGPVLMISYGRQRAHSAGSTPDQNLVDPGNWWEPQITLNSGAYSFLPTG